MDQKNEEQRRGKDMKKESEGVKAPRIRVKGVSSPKDSGVSRQMGKQEQTEHGAAYRHETLLADRRCHGLFDPHYN